MAPSSIRLHPIRRYVKALPPHRARYVFAAWRAIFLAALAAMVAAALALRRSGDQAFILLGIVLAVIVAWCVSWASTRIHLPAAAAWFTQHNIRVARIATACIALVLFVVWIALDTSQRSASNFVALGGYVACIALSLALSNAPLHVLTTERGAWPVVSGTIAQLTLGILILRTKAGYALFAWFGEQVEIFFRYSEQGAIFLFGDDLVNMENGPAFLVAMIGIAFFGAFAELGIYLGITQAVIGGLAAALRIGMGISSVEAVNAAANIFVGSVNTPQMIKPYLLTLTNSELFCVLTAGYATTAGAIFGVYISFGVSPTHLIAASVVSAPAAILIAKIMHPADLLETPPPTEENNNNRASISSSSGPRDETLTTTTTDKDDGCTYESATEAFAAGITDAISLILSIVFFVSVFISTVAFVDGVLGWLGSMVGAPYVNLEYLLSYAMFPFAVLMGVPISDAQDVALLLAQKTVVNELYAYRTLGQMMSGATPLSRRAEIIATWALCGFSNVGQCGILLGAYRSLAPSRVKTVAALVWPSLIAGWLACVMTACVAGWLL